MRKTPFLPVVFVFVIFISSAMPLAADCGGAHDAAAESSEVVPVVKSEIAGIRNYTKVGDRMGFGGTTEPSAMEALKAEGYRSVVNLRLASEDGVDVDAAKQAAEQAGLEYIHLPFDSSNPAPDYFAGFLAAVDDESMQPVYVHCGSATRAAALWMTKRVIDDGWSLEDAAAEARGIAGKPDSAVAFATKYIESQK